VKVAQKYRIPIAVEVVFFSHHEGNRDVPDQNLVRDFVVQALNQQAAKATLVGDVAVAVTSVATGHSEQQTPWGTLMITSAKETTA